MVETKAKLCVSLFINTVVRAARKKVKQEFLFGDPCHDFNRRNIAIFVHYVEVKIPA